MHARLVPPPAAFAKREPGARRGRQLSEGAEGEHGVQR
jgi:hypothetical protein